MVTLNNSYAYASRQQLCQFLSSSETRQRVHTQQKGAVNRIVPGILNDGDLKRHRNMQVPKTKENSTKDPEAISVIAKAASIARTPRLVTRPRKYKERIPRGGKD